MHTPIQLGLTGGIGSGKSTLARMLAVHGAAWIDADAVARSVTAPGGSAIAPIRAAFGDAMIDATGALDRARMRELAFGSPAARQQLEAIVHPLVGQQTALHAQEAAQQGATAIVFDIPLLVESARWRPLLDAIIVVDCKERTQVERVMARNGLAQAEVERIMASQASRAQRLNAADVVVYNDSQSLQDLEMQAARIAARFGL
jgi:dephospho-CoA kinase